MAHYITSFDAAKSVIEKTTGEATLLMNMGDGQLIMNRLILKFMHAEVSVCIKSYKSNAAVKACEHLEYGEKFFEVKFKSGYEINQIKEVQAKLIAVY